MPIKITPLASNTPKVVHSGFSMSLARKKPELLFLLLFNINKGKMPETAKQTPAM